MDSLSGEGKAGSDDIRLDVEFSSSSHTSSGRRRQTRAKKKPQEEVKSKCPEVFKGKRKAKPDIPGGGPGAKRVKKTELHQEEQQNNTPKSR